ncbi:hypothetical protein LTR85_008382 [Meristemomyces frigidus]|nr:hypothetical protein LTR85_008382 [Meristemomyces frigidus]
MTYNSRMMADGDRTVIPRYAPLKDPFLPVETGPNPYRGDPIGTPINILHVDGAGKQTTTRAGARQASRNGVHVPTTTRLCSDVHCQHCYPPEPSVLTYHFVGKRDEGEVALDNQAMADVQAGTTGSLFKHVYVPCEDAACAVCTAEGKARQRQMALWDADEETVATGNNREEVAQEATERGIEERRFDDGVADL